MATTLTAFHDAKLLYRQFTGYTTPLSFEEWATKNPDHKAAILFVQFYNQIVTAWMKAKEGNLYEFIEGEEGVSTVCQYLQKNVPIIENNPKRFTPAYIYKVAYNCLYCICHDRKCDRERWENETSSIVSHDGEELDLFDTITDYSMCPDKQIEARDFEREFWQVVEDEGQPAEKVLRYLLSQDAADLKKLNPRSKQYKTDPLRDIEVSLEEAQKIIARLREKFLDLSKDSSCGQYILKFASCLT